LAAGEQVLSELRDRLTDTNRQRDEAVAAAEEKARQEAVQVAAASDSPGANQEAQESPPEKVEAPQANEKTSDEAKDDKVASQAREAAKPFDNRIKWLDSAIAEVEGHKAVATGDYKSGLELFKKARDVDPPYLAQVRFLAGETEDAIKDAESYVKSHEQEVQPLAWLVYLLWQADRKEEAKSRFDELRSMSTHIDLDTPVFGRLASIAGEFGYPEDWRVVQQPLADVGQRPDLDTLGPFRWSPSPAPDWTLKDAEGTTFTLKQYQGQPLIVIFYLGYGCLHCAEQLQAFAPMTDEFEKAGFKLIAISTDDTAGLKMSLANYKDGQFPFPLVSNADLDVFKAYRTYDDFEGQALHGTFVIDGDGRVRWQDISYEPFMDPKFVLDEGLRQLQR
jgi:peroxiredoxin